MAVSARAGGVEVVLDEPEPLCLSLGHDEAPSRQSPSSGKVYVYTISSHFFSSAPIALPVLSSPPASTLWPIFEGGGT